MAKGCLWTGHIRGIDVGVQLCSLVTALVAFLSLAESFEAMLAGGSTLLDWSAAATGVLLVGASLALRSTAQVMVARARDLPVRSVTVGAQGGVIEVQKELWDGTADLWIGSAGLLTHLLLGAGLLGSAWVLGWAPSVPTSTAVALLAAVGSLNLALFGLQLVPAFPMDGGRLLRALVLRRGGDVGRAARLGAQAGQAVALGLIAFGLVRLLQGGGFSAPLVLIGWLLYRAVHTDGPRFSATLRSLRVADVMQSPSRVDSRTSVSDLVELSAEELLAQGRFHVITESDSVAGLVTAREVKNLPRAKWTTTRVDQVMREVDPLTSVGAGSSLTEALEILGPYDVQHVPVIESGTLVGTITRDIILELTAPQMTRQTNYTNEPGPILGRPMGADAGYSAEPNPAAPRSRAYA